MFGHNKKIAEANIKKLKQVDEKAAQQEDFAQTNSQLSTQIKEQAIVACGWKTLYSDALKSKDMKALAKNIDALEIYQRKTTEKKSDKKKAERAEKITELKQIKNIAELKELGKPNKKPAPLNVDSSGTEPVEVKVSPTPHNSPRTASHTVLDWDRGEVIQGTDDEIALQAVFLEQSLNARLIQSDTPKQSSGCCCGLFNRKKKPLLSLDSPSSSYRKA